MKELWEKMEDWYGTKWTGQFGPFADDKGPTRAVRNWAEALYAVTPNRLLRGLRLCTERDNPFPPTLPEFLKLCAKREWE